MSDFTNLSRRQLAAIIDAAIYGIGPAEERSQRAVDQITALIGKEDDR